MFLYYAEEPDDTQAADEYHPDEDKGSQASDQPFVVTASEEDQKLGFSVTAYPPNEVFIKSITEDLWADRAGLEVDDEIVYVNGKDVAEMDRQSFVLALKARPLQLTCLPFIEAEDDGAGSPSVPRKSARMSLKDAEALERKLREEAEEEARLKEEAAKKRQAKLQKAHMTMSLFTRAKAAKAAKQEEEDAEEIKRRKLEERRVAEEAIKKMERKQARREAEEQAIEAAELAKQTAKEEADRIKAEQEEAKKQAKKEEARMKAEAVQQRNEELAQYESELEAMEEKKRLEAEEEEEVKTKAEQAEEAEEAQQRVEQSAEAHQAKQEEAQPRVEQSAGTDQATQEAEQKEAASAQKAGDEAKDLAEAEREQEDIREAGQAAQSETPREKKKEEGEEKDETQTSTDLVGLKITIVGATGLRTANSFSEGNPFCFCESPGQFEFKTRVFKKSLSPTWNHVEDCSYKVGSGGIRFTIRDKYMRGPILAVAHVAEMQFYPDGFSGELDLQDAGEGATAKLKIQVKVQMPEDLSQLQSTLADARRRLTAEAAQAQEAQALQQELASEKEAAAELPVWEERLSSLEEAQSAAQEAAADDTVARREETTRQRELRQQLAETNKKLRVGQSQILAAERTQDREEKLLAEYSKEAQLLQSKVEHAEVAEEASEAAASESLREVADSSEKTAFAMEGAELGRLQYEVSATEEQEKHASERAADAEKKYNVLSDESAQVRERLDDVETLASKQEERLSIMLSDRDSEAIEVTRLRAELRRVESRASDVDRLAKRSSAKLERQTPVAATAEAGDAGFEQVKAHVPFSFKIDGLSYAKLEADLLLKAQVCDALANGIGELTGVSSSDVEVQLSSGSVRAEVKVQHQDSQTVLDAHKKLVAAAAVSTPNVPSGLQVLLTMAVEGVAGIGSVADGTIEASNVEVAAPLGAHTLAPQHAEMDREVASFYAEKVEKLRQELTEAQAESEMEKEMATRAQTLQSEEVTSAARAIMATEAAQAALVRGAELLSNTVELIAGPAEKVLGMALDSSEPGRIIVKDVSVRGWAHQNGVEVGTTVLAIEGMDACTMTSDKLKALLKMRPLKFSMQMPWRAPLNATAAEVGAALTPLAEVELLRAELYEARQEARQELEAQKPGSLLDELDGYMPQHLPEVLQELQEEASQVQKLTAVVGMEDSEVGCSPKLQSMHGTDEEATAADLRQRVRDARLDAAEAAAAAYFAQNSTGENYSGMHPVVISAKLSENTGDPLALAASLHHERKVCQDLRRELNEVEDAAVETAEAAETRVNQIEHTMRGRRIAFQTAEHAAESEARAREEAYAELHQANAVARTARTTAAQLRDELERAQRATWHEGIVADDLRRQISEVTDELAQSGGERMGKAKSGRMRKAASSKPVGREMSPTSQAEELRRTAEELRESVKNWRAKSPGGQPDSPEPWSGPWQSLQERVSYADETMREPMQLHRPNPAQYPTQGWGPPQQAWDDYPQAPFSSKLDPYSDSYGNHALGLYDAGPGNQPRRRQFDQDEYPDDISFQKVRDRAQTIQRQMQNPAYTIDRTVPYLDGEPPPVSVPRFDDEDYAQD